VILLATATDLISSEHGQRNICAAHLFKTLAMYYDRAGIAIGEAPPCPSVGTGCSCAAGCRRPLARDDFGQWTEQIIQPVLDKNERNQTKQSQENKQLEKSRY